jgi:hypothetical protein
MFAGLLGAIFRRYQADPDGYASHLSAHFVWVVTLFGRFKRDDRDAFTFHHYFRHPTSARAVAKHQKSTLAEEQGHVFRFLENLAACVEEEAPAIERELKTDLTRLTPGSDLWAMTLLRRELAGLGPSRRWQQS